jgi:hypothetical protein
MERIVQRASWILAAICTAGVVFMLIVGPPGVDPTRPFDWLALTMFAIIPVSFAVTAAAILSKQPKNAVGWALMVPAVSFVASSLVQTYFGGFGASPTSLEWWQMVLVIFENFSWVLLIFPIFHLMLIFPNGNLLSSRWRPLVWLEGVMILVMVGLSTFTEEIGPSETMDWTFANPIGFLPVDIFDGLFALLWSVGLIVMTLGGVLALVMRFRRSARVERQQIKWMLIAVSFFGVVYVTNAALSGFSVGGLADTLLGLSVNLLAVAIAFGVLKYRLFDIDRFISRTVGYVLVVGLLAAVYITLAVWLPSTLAGDSAIFVAGATLAVAALFNPVRRAVLRGVDRRFYRSRYNMERLVEEFGGRLQNQTDVGGLRADWIGVVSETLQPSSIGVWVRH